MKLSSTIVLFILGCLVHSCSSPLSDDPFSDSHRTIIDSLSVNKEKGINLYLYYYDSGVFGRSMDHYLAINSCSCKLKADSALLTSPYILKIDKKGDTVDIILSTNKYKVIDSTQVPFKIIIDEKTWRYVK